MASKYRQKLLTTGIALSTFLSACGQTMAPPVPTIYRNSYNQNQVFSQINTLRNSPVQTSSASHRLKTPTRKAPSQIRKRIRKSNQAQNQSQYQLLVDRDQIFPKIYDMLESAKEKIQIDIFLFGGEIASRMADILIAKQKEGVKIQFVTDKGMGVIPLIKDQVEPVIKKMVQNGIDVKTFPVNTMPKDLTFISNFKLINHMKVVVVDDKKAVLGGMNFVDVEAGNRDYMVYLEGEQAKALGAIVNKDWWMSPSFEKYKKFNFTRTKNQFQLRKQSVSSYLRNEPREPVPGFKIGETWINQRSARKLVLDTIKSAKTSIHGQIFMIDEPEVVYELVQAKRRGVKVRLHLDNLNIAEQSHPLVEKLKVNGAPNLAAIQDFQKANIELGWYVPRRPHDKLHAKTMVIDEEKVLMGSTNFTLRALWKNREMNVVITDANLAQQMLSAYEEDWTLRREEVKPLTTWQKMIAWSIRKLLGKVFEIRS